MSTDVTERDALGDALEQQSSSQGPAPYEPTQEMRFAIVLYGGVSLAIYINGVVQELLRLVRATAPAKPAHASPDSALLAPHELAGTERVYRVVGQLARWGGAADAGLPGADDPILTRFIVDVISGASAGGINGIFLAKALVHDQSLDQLRNLWVSEAAIESIVNDSGSLIGSDGQPLSGLSPQVPPRSALNSRRMYRQLLMALHEMPDPGPGFVVQEQPLPPDRPPLGSSCLVDELDLWLTTTDIEGLELPLDLYDGVVWERKHKNVFHFLYATAVATGAARNDLGWDSDPFLAYAARCTSAFPFAFEPMLLSDIDEAAQTFLRYANALITSESNWDRYLSDYVRRAHTYGVYDTKPWSSTAFGDGGYLDNKPFSWATERLARRHASLPVDRRLLYVEPDPKLMWFDVHDEAPSPAPPPNALDNAYAAKVSLPRVETIREDLERVLERNRQLARLSTIAAAADDVLANDWSRDQVLEWRARVLDEDRPEHAQFRAYHRLKMASVLDDLADVVTRLRGWDERSDQATAVRCFVQAWVELRDNQTETDLLQKFDVSFRLRRLNFLGARVDRLLALEAPPGVPGWEAPSGEELADYLSALRIVKRTLDGAFVDIRGAARALRSPRTNPVVANILDRLDLDREQLLGVLKGARTSGESVAAARTLLQGSPLMAALNDAADALATAIEPVLTATRQRSEAAVAGEPAELFPTAGRAQGEAFSYLARVAAAYEIYDSIVFPIGYGNVDEADRVELIRISSQDATSLVDERARAREAAARGGHPRQKLAGIGLGHFAGFFARGWRENDLLWGRLDTAERLIDTILADHPEREALVREAQRAIVREQFAGMDHADKRIILGAPDIDDPDEILDRLSSHEVDRELDKKQFMTTVGRATTVTASLLESIAGAVAPEPAAHARRPLPRPANLPMRIVAGVAATVARIAESAVNPAKSRLFWAAIVGLIAGGALVGLGWNDGGVRAGIGWTLISAGAAVVLAGVGVRSLAFGRKLLAWAGLGAAGVALFACVLFLLALLGGTVRDALGWLPGF